MNIQKRSLPVFILLNCLTLGIYGAIQCSRIGNEVNALCKQDGEQPGMSYFGALFIRAIPAFFGVVIGLITGIVSSSFVFNALPFMNNSMRILKMLHCSIQTSRAGSNLSESSSRRSTICLRRQIHSMRS